MVLLVMVSLSSVLWGGNIPEKEARTVAVNWINSVNDFSYSEENIQLVYPKAADDTLLYYLVSFDPIAWVIISATNKIEPVLAYSTNSAFDGQVFPIQMYEWMEGIEHEIKLSNSPNYVSDQNLPEKWAKLKLNIHDPVIFKSASTDGVEPLLSCNWDQGKYFNEFAPYESASTTKNDHVWMGCVATAMAQLMKYWSYPVVGKDSFSYEHQTYGKQSANFGAAVYNWDAMPDQLSTENAEVQKISYHTAVSVHMDFGPFGSGAYLEDAQEALINYFKYNTTIFESSKLDWTEKQWKKLLKNELDMQRPVIYSGKNKSGFNGHAFICDGYTNDYFHFNWGWGGYGNGYFLLSALNVSGGNYSSYQDALFGIEPIETSAFILPYDEGFESGTAGMFKLNGISSLTAGESHSGKVCLRLGEASFSSPSKNSASISLFVADDCDLSFWVKRYAPVASDGKHQVAELYMQYGQTKLATIFDGDFNDSVWVNYTIDLSMYKGQVVRLQFTQYYFGAKEEQWMFIDDVELKERKEQQFLSANANAEYHYGDGFIDLKVNSTAQLEPYIQLSDGNILENKGGKLQIIGVGECDVTVSQAGNRLYDAATDLVFTIHVLKGLQTISFPALKEVAYGDSIFTLHARSSSGNEVVFESSNPEVAEIEDNVIHIQNAGVAKITAIQKGNEFWNAAVPIAHNLIVKRARQLIETNLPDTIKLGSVITHDHFKTSSGLNVTDVYSSNENIVNISDLGLLVKSTGNFTINALQGGNPNFEASSNSFDFVVENKVYVPKIELDRWSVSPNPNQGRFELYDADYMGLPFQLKILNAQGQHIASYTIEGTHLLIDLNEARSGVYFLLFQTEAGIETKKILIH